MIAEPPATSDVALAGHDGAEAARLLQRAQDEGTAVLGDILYDVVRRNLGGGKLAFTEAERQDLADALAAVTASGELLGRARIRKRQEMAQHFAEDAAGHEHAGKGEGGGQFVKKD